MTVRVIDPPEPVVTLEEAKRHLRVTWGEDDDLIAGLISAAQQHIDGPAGWLGRSIGVQTLEATRGRFDCGRNLLLPCPPAIEIVSVAYLDAAGTEQTVAAGDFRLVDSRVWFGPTFSFPATSCAPDAVRIRYRAGYDGATTGDVPAPITAAMLLMIGHLYAQREATSADALSILPMGVDALLSPFRIWSI